jgi:hypothetical protein
MITLSMELTDETEKGAFGVGVMEDVIVGTGVAVSGTRFARVPVAGGVMEGSNVAVGGVTTVAVTVQVGSIWSGVIVGEGVRI